MVHIDDPSRFRGPELKGLWNSMSQRMRAMLPASCERMAAMLERARVRERLYTCAARDVTSDDLLVCNVGVSAAYHSPSHVDARDVGWTFAFSVKCDHEVLAAERCHGRKYRCNSDGDGPAVWGSCLDEVDDGSHSDGEAPTLGERLPWEHEEGAYPEDGRDGPAVLRSNAALAWQRVWREMYPQHGGGELLALFLHSPSESQNEAQTYSGADCMLNTDDPSGLCNSHMVQGLRHFAAHRHPELMRRFLPGVAHFEEVDQLAFAIKADLDRWSGGRGRRALADNRRATDRSEGNLWQCGSLFLSFHGPSRVFCSGNYPPFRRTVGPPWTFGPLEVAPHLAGSAALHSYVKSLLFFGEDELDCLCSLPGPPSTKNLLLVTRLLLEQRHLCPLLAEWLWKTMRLIMVEDEHSCLGRLPMELKRTVAQEWLAMVIPARLQAHGAWRALLSGRDGREHRGAWQTLWERSYGMGRTMAWPGARDLLRPRTSGGRRKVLRPGQVLCCPLCRLVLAA